MPVGSAVVHGRRGNVTANAIRVGRFAVSGVIALGRSGGHGSSLERAGQAAAPEHDPASSTTGGHISTELRINERIRVPEVRLVGPNGEQVGIVGIDAALRLAEEADLDLVEVAATARPPVCKLMDYGKFKYENAQKAREARRNQVNTVIKEIKLRPRIDPHDYNTKKGHVVRFLGDGDKVKVSVMFRRGREQGLAQLGFRLLQQMADEVDELGHVESAPRLDGRDMIMVLAPNKKKTAVRAERAAKKTATASAARAEAEEAQAPASAPAASAPVAEPAENTA
jgi:translation initiation factor IF-3